MAESRVREGVVDLVMTLALEQLRTGQICEGPRDAIVLEDLSDFCYLWVRLYQFVNCPKLTPLRPSISSAEVVGRS